MRYLLPLMLVPLMASATLAQPATAPTVLHLSQSAERHLERDLLHVDLRAEKTGTDPQTVETAINQSMAKALAQARQVPGVVIETGSYGVYRETPQNGPVGWTGSQNLTLTGADADVLLKLAGRLQTDGLVMSNLAYEASPKVVRGAEDDLTKEALAALAQRAAEIAQQLQLSVLGYRDLTVGNAQTEGAPTPRFAVLASGVAPMPAPVAAPGEATVRVTVSAEILLGLKQP
jgi:predicted secreted protein